MQVAAIRALTSAGLSLDDDAGNTGIDILDGGIVHIPSKAGHAEELMIGDDVSALVGFEGYTNVTIMDADNVPGLLVGKDATHNVLFNWVGDARQATAPSRLLPAITCSPYSRPPTKLRLD